MSQGFQSLARRFAIAAWLLPAFFLAACITTKPQFAQPRVITSSKAAAAAKRYASANLGYPNPVVQKDKVFFGQNYYTVVVWNDLQKPGDFAIIDLDKKLNVLGWSPGQ